MIFWTALAIGAVFWGLGGRKAWACTSMGVGRGATTDGSVLISHSVDGWYDQRVRIVPGGDHSDGETVEIWGDVCYETRPELPVSKRGEIPQVPHTYGYFHVGYPFMNDQGVTIAEHTWLGREEAACKAGLMFIANLQILGLQRGATARETVRVMGELAERWGYCDMGEALIVGDGDEAWVFEIAGPGTDWTPDCGRPGAHWVAVRVPDDAFFVGANRARIGVVDFDDRENVMWSTDLTVYPEKMGWWKVGEPFNFAATFNPQPYGYHYYAARREWRVMSLLVPSKEWPIYDDRSAYPMFVVPDHKLTVQDLMVLYSDHLEGTPFDTTKGPAAGPFGNPTRWTQEQRDLPDDLKGLDWERTIAVYRCSYSFVAQCRKWLPRPMRALLWLGEDAPDTTVYAPLYCGMTRLPEAWSRGRRDVFDPDCAWWAFNLVRNWACLRWNAMYAEIRSARNDFERRFFGDQADFERRVIDLWGDRPDDAQALVTDYSCGCLDDLCRDWWALAWRLIGRYHNGMMTTPQGGQHNPGYDADYLRSVGFGATVCQKERNTNIASDLPW